MFTTDNFFIRTTKIKIVKKKTDPQTIIPNNLTKLEQFWLKQKVGLCRTSLQLTIFQGKSLIMTKVKIAKTFL